MGIYSMCYIMLIFFFFRSQWDHTWKRIRSQRLQQGFQASQLRCWATETWLHLRIKLTNYKDGRDEKKKRERDEFVAKGSRAGHRISAGDTVCATWEQDCRKRMLGDRQGQQLVGKKEDRVVYLKALFKYMIRARQTQKSEQTEVRTCSVCSCRTEFAVTVQKPQRCYLTGLVLFAGRRKWKWLVSMQKTETLLVKVLIISRKSPFGPGNPSFPMA